MRRVRLDNLLGMIMSQITTWSIIVVAATVLHANHITKIVTAADAAKMLEPLVHNFPHAGLIAKIIFSIGIIGLGLIAVPVLAGSSSYAICELLDFPKGFNHRFRSAKVFYSIMLISSLIGIGINYIGIDPINALVYSAVLNGILAVPLIFIIALIGQNERIMGKYKSGITSQIFIWLTFLCMFISVIICFLPLVKGEALFIQNHLFVYLCAFFYDKDVLN